MAGELYDDIGRTYMTTRRADPRIAAAIDAAIGDATSIVNVGAGTGAYEPVDRDVVAVEPSEVMIAQRPPELSAEVVRAEAEDLPFEADSFDVALAVLSDHHWRDRAAGLRELARVARERVVLFNANPADVARFWLTTEYLPGFGDLIPAHYREPGAWAVELRQIFGNARFVAVPIPHDCVDGFYGAYWRRPEAYLDPVVRAGISVFPRLDPDQVSAGLRRLRRDLESGAWLSRHGDLLALDELDLGYYVVVADAAAP